MWLIQDTPPGTLWTLYAWLIWSEKASSLFLAFNYVLRKKKKKKHPTEKQFAQNIEMSPEADPAQNNNNNKT